LPGKRIAEGKRIVEGKLLLKGKCWREIPEGKRTAKEGLIESLH
jgi:hypothetical protein